MQALTVSIIIILVGVYGTVAALINVTLVLLYFNSKRWLRAAAR